MREAVADTSSVVVLANRDDLHFKRCSAAFFKFDQIWIPEPSLGEIGYMLWRELGNRGVVYFLRNLPKSRYQLISLQEIDYQRTADILDKYADARLDFVDATIVALRND